MTESENQRKNKAVHNRMREEKDRSEGIQTCTVLVHSVLAFDMDHTKNLKVKDLKVLLRYYFWSEKLKGIPNKLELMRSVTEFLERLGRVLCRGRGGGGLL